MNTKGFNEKKCRDEHQCRCIYVDHYGQRWEARLIGRQIDYPRDYIIGVQSKMISPCGDSCRLENLLDEPLDFPDEVVIKINMDDLATLANKRNGLCSVWAFRTDKERHQDPGDIRLTLKLPAEVFNRLRTVPAATNAALEQAQ